MNNHLENLGKSSELAKAVAKIHRHRIQKAQERYQGRMETALSSHAPAGEIKIPWGVWQEWYQYTSDMAQRSILFWDIMRERGNVFVEHEKAGKPPVRKQEKTAPKLAARRRTKTAETPATRAQTKPTAKPAVRKQTKRRTAGASA